LKSTLTGIKKTSPRRGYSSGLKRSFAGNFGDLFQKTGPVLFEDDPGVLKPQTRIKEEKCDAGREGT
jgi:hypothetical protein